MQLELGQATVPVVMVDEFQLWGGKAPRPLLQCVVDLGWNHARFIPISWAELPLWNP